MDPFSVNSHYFSTRECVNEYTFIALGTKDTPCDFRPSVTEVTNKDEINCYLLMNLDDNLWDIIFRTASKVTVEIVHVHTEQYPRDPTIYNSVYTKVYAEWDNEGNYLEWKISQ